MGKITNKIIYRLLIVVCILLSAQCVFAQHDISGRVSDKTTNETLAGVNIVVKRPNGKIAKFTTTNGEGRFSLSLPQVDSLSLEVNIIGYESYKCVLPEQEQFLDIRLTAGSLQLREVTVKADRIREQGDTISYTVGQFAQEQDRSIGDVLKRMPGINVESSGKIQYQGEDINKFYIEGSDLLGGRYGIATNGISHDDVGAVEVMENHQPMQVLSGISFSDKAASTLN